MSTHELLPFREFLPQRSAIEPIERVRDALIKPGVGLMPDKFCEYFLQTDLWDTQRKILQALVTSPRVAVKACHASSKTFTAARALLWFMQAYTKATVVTTAPTWGQVERLLWGEVHSALMQSLLPYPKNGILKTELRLGPDRHAYGLSTSVTNQDEGVKFQGIHNANVLMILDEAPGVDAKIWEAIEGARAGGNVRILAIGNPTISSGPFHDAFTRNRGTWDCFTISAFDTPNFARCSICNAWDCRIHPNHNQKIDLGTLLQLSEAELKDDPRSYLTRKKWVKERYYEWGEGHPLWEARVLGQFPTQSVDSLLSLAWIENASRRELVGTGKLYAGIDVAGPGESETSLTIRRGAQIIVHEQWPISDPVGQVVNILNKYKGEFELINVDAVGLGWGMYTHLVDLKFPAVPIIAQHPSNDNEKFHMLKDEFYWGLRERFLAGDISGPLDETTIGQLAGIRYKHNHRGQVEIESKDAAAKRGVPSPDRAESIMLAFGGQQLVFGVLEANRPALEKEQMQKVQISSLQKPMTSSNQISCEKCSAICIARCGSDWRCGQCGYQWPVIPKAVEKPIGGRTDTLMKMNRAVRLDD